jgi:hypothetical protein
MIGDRPGLIDRLLDVQQAVDHRIGPVLPVLLGNVNRKLTICDNPILTTPERCLKFEMTKVNHLTLSLSGRA